MNKKHLSQLTSLSLIFSILFTNITPALAATLDQANQPVPIPKLLKPFTSEAKISQAFGEKYEEGETPESIGELGMDGHNGIDYELPEGTPILATDDGTVEIAGEDDFGLTVKLGHSWGSSIYGHLSKVEVEKGKEVKKGDKIALSGTTGISTGPHLHFSIKPKNVDETNGYLGFINPQPYLETLIPPASQNTSSLPPELQATASASLQKFLESSSSAKQATSSSVLAASVEASRSALLSKSLESSPSARLEDISTNSEFLYNYKFQLKGDSSVHFYDKQTKRPSFAIADKDYNYKLRFFLKDSQTEDDKKSQPKVSANTIEFPVHISSISATLKYTVSENQVKEEFIINEKPTKDRLDKLDQLEISFDTQNIGLKYEKVGDEYKFYSEKNELYWTLSKPVVIEKDGKTHDISLNLSDNKAMLSLDKQILENANYPLVIDPTVIINTSSTTVATQASNQRHLVRTSDGTLHSFIQIGTQTSSCAGNPSGLIWLYSTDSGSTWTCGDQLSSDTTNLMYASATTDSSDNIYLTYSQTASGGGTTKDVLYRKLTKGSGASWTVGGAQTVLDSASASIGYAYSVIEKEQTNSRLWLATRYYDGTNYQVSVYYSDGLTDTPNWTVSQATLSATGTDITSNIPTITKFGTKIAVIYSGATASTINWRYRSDSDTLTSWVAAFNIASSLTIANGVFSAVGDSSGKIYLAYNSGTSVTFQYYNGFSWSGATVASTGVAGNTQFVSVAADGTSAWVMYSETTGLSSSLSGSRKLVYKKGFAPFAAANFDSSATSVVDYHNTFDKVWLFNNGASSYVDDTTDAGNTTSADVTHATTGGMIKSTDDAIYFGKSQQFDAISWDVSTNASGGAVAWEYWNGSTWASLSFTVSSATGFTADGYGAFTTPGDWATTTVNGEGTSYYYIRARVTSAITTAPVGVQMATIPQINAASLLASPVSNNIYAVWTENAASPTRVRTQQISATPHVVAATASSANITNANIAYSSTTNATQPSTMRHIVRTSDGTLHAFLQAGTIDQNNCTVSGGLFWYYSTDSGSTWNCGSQLSSDTTNLMYASATTDSSDNIYVVYSIATTGANASYDVFYRKLTKGVGATWTVGNAQTALDASSTQGYSYTTIEKETTNNRLWLATRYFDNTNYQVSVYYSDGLTDAPTWTASQATLDTANTTNTSHYPVITKFGSKVAVLYNNATIRWKFRSDSDGLTSWSTEAVASSSSLTTATFTAAPDSLANIYLAANVSTTVTFTHFNGVLWSGLATVSSAAITTAFVSLAVENGQVYIGYGETTGLSSSLSGSRKLVYKRGVAPFATADFDTNSTSIVDYHNTFDKLWLFSSAAGTYQDETTDAGNTTSADVFHSTSTKFLNAIGDVAYFGKSQKFDSVNWDVSTNGTTGVTVWEYWNGSTWVGLSNILNTSQNSFAADGYINFIPNTDWATTTVNGEGTSYYYLRARVITAYGTAPIGVQFSSIPQVNWFSAVPNPVSNTIYSIWTENAASPTRIRTKNITVTPLVTSPAAAAASVNNSTIAYSSTTLATQPSTMKNIIRTSDGTLHAFIQGGTIDQNGCTNSQGLLWLYSTDTGSTWSCGGQLSSDTTNLMYASAATDASDNIYVVYSIATTGGNAAYDLFFRKLTKGVGATWTVENAQTVLDSAGTSAGYSYAVIEKETTNDRLWIALRHYNGTNYQVAVYYSDGLTTAPTWTASSTALDTANTTNTSHLPAIVKFGSKLGVIYNNATLKWRFRSDADGLTSWTTESDVNTSGSLTTATFAVASDSNSKVYVAHNSSTSIFFAYFNGSVWTPSTTVSSAAASAAFVGLSVSSGNVWIYYGDTTNLSSSLSGSRKLVYKKGVPPYTASDFDSTATSLNDHQSTLDKLWLYSSADGSYTDDTTDSANTTTADTIHATSTKFLSVSGDIAYFGKSQKFDSLTWVMSTAGVGGNVIWEYWNGSAWVALTTYLNTANHGLLATTGHINFTPNSDWATTAVNGEGTSYYYLRARVVTSYTTAPIGTQIATIPLINWASAVAAPNSSSVYTIWTENAASATRVRFKSNSVTATTAASSTANLAPTVTAYSSTSNATQPSNMRNIIHTSDGTLHAFVQSGTLLGCGGNTSSNNNGLLWVYSTDSGSTWTCGDRLSSDTTNLMYASATTDSSDNVYVVYSVATTGGNAAYDLFYRKLTKGVGATWTVESAQTVLDSGGTSAGYSYAVIEKETTNNTLWIALRHYNGTNYQVAVYYSDGLSAAPTWTVSQATLDTANTTTTSHYPTIVKFGSKLGVIYNNATLFWRYRADSDGLTTWNAEATITTTGSLTTPTFSAVGLSNGNVYLSHNSSTTVYFTHYNGASWSAANTVSSSAASSAYVSLSAINGNAWVVYGDTTGLSSGLSGSRKLVYKKGYLPFTSNEFDTTATSLVTQHATADKYWSYVGGSYTDDTTDASSTTSADTQTITSAGDILYFGKSQKFDALSWDVSTAGVGGTLTWEYYNGSSWVGISDILVNSSTNLTADGYITFIPNSNWATTTINGEGTSYYYIRARAITSYTTSPIGVQFASIPQINWGSVIQSPVSSTVHGIWTENAASPIRVRYSSFSASSTITPSSSATAEISPSVLGYSSATGSTQVSNQRHMVRTSDGTLHAFVNIGTATATCSSALKPGLLWFYSTDSGATWTCGDQLSSDTTNVMYASATTDSSDNIYVVYSQATTTGGTAKDVFYRKLTKGVGATWTVESAQTALDGTSTVGYHYAVIEKETTNNRLWIASRFYNGTNYQVSVYYSSDLTAAPTWTASQATLDTANTTANHIPAIVKFGSKLGVIYNNSNGYWRIRSDSDTETTWQPEIQISTTAPVSGNLSVASDSSNNVYVVFNSGTSVLMHYFNGITWSPQTTITSAALSGTSVSIAASNNNIWVYYLDATNLSSGLSGSRKVAYKRGYFPFSSSDFDTTATAVATYNGTLDKYWSYLSSAYTDDTTDSSSTTTADTQMVSGVGDIAYFGKTAKFDSLSWDLSTLGVAGQVVWEYYNGSSWSAISNVVAASNTGFQGDGYISFIPNNDWATAAINSEGTSYYYLRARVLTAYTTAPVGVQLASISQQNWVSTTANVASNTIYSMWTENAAVSTKIRSSSTTTTNAITTSSVGTSELTTTIAYTGTANATRFANQKKLIRTSDGTLHAFVQQHISTKGCSGTDAAGMIWMYSTDSGSTWSCGGQLSSDTTNLVTASATTDSSDNIYVIYSLFTTGGGATKDVFYRKLTKGVGASWTLEAEQTALDGTSTTGYHYATIEKEATNNRLWIASRYYDGTNYKVVAYYSSDLSTTPTWAASDTALDTANTTSTNHYPVIVKFGSKLGIIYNNTALKWRYRSDSDSVTSWNTEANINSTITTVNAPTFAAVADSTNIYLAFNTSENNVFFTYYNGTSWSSAATITGIAYPSSTVGLSLEGTSVWVFYDDGAGLSTSLSNSHKLSYKRGVSPFATENFDQASTGVVSYESTFDKVWSYIGGTYTDETTDAASTTTADTNIISGVGDIIYLGKTTKFDYPNWVLSTSGVGGMAVWEYWNGSSWVGLSKSLIATSTALTGSGYFSFIPNSDWATTTVNGEGTSYYYLRIRATSAYTTAPIATQFTTAPLGNGVNVIPAPISNSIYLMWNEGLSSIYKIKFGTVSTTTNSTPPTAVSLTVASGFNTSSWPTTQANNQRQGVISRVDSTYFTNNSFYTAASSLSRTVTDTSGNVYTYGSSESGTYYLYSINSSGSLNWKSTLSGSPTAYPVVDSTGHIWIGSLNNTQRITRFTSSGSQACQFDTQSNIVNQGEPVIGSNGNIYFQLPENTSTSNLYSIDSNCNQNWTVNITKRSTGLITLSPDESALYISGQYPGSNVGPMMARSTIDGSSLWEISGGAFWSGVSVTADGSKIFALANNPANGGGHKWILYSINASTGATLWTKDLITDLSCVSSCLPTERGIPAIDSSNNVYVGTYDQIISYDQNGNLRWTLTNSTGHERSGVNFYPIVDNNSHLFVSSSDGYIYAINSNTGEKYATYQATPSGNLISYAGGSSFYYVVGASIYKLSPWTLSASADRTNVNNSETIQFTATSSMLKRDPNASEDNKVQAVMPNGDKVPLLYDSTDSDNRTVWKGSYKMPLTVAAGKHDIRVEAIAYQTSTNNSTSFDLTSGFNNSGISTTVCITAHSQGSCDSSSSSTVSTNPTYSLSYNINLSTSPLNSVYTISALASDKALILINKSAVVFDTLIDITKRSAQELISGLNPDKIRFNLPRFNLISDFWDFRAFAAYSGAAFTKFKDKFVIQLPFDKSTFNNLTENGKNLSKVNIVALDKITNTWEVLPNTVINTSQNTAAAFTDELTIYALGLASNIEKAGDQTQKTIAQTELTAQDIFLKNAKKPIEGLEKIANTSSLDMVYKATEPVKGVIAQITPQVVKDTTEKLAEFLDQFQSGTKLFLAAFDKNPTKVSDVRIANITPDSAVIYWKTNHPSDSKVNYGLSPSYGHETRSDKLTTEHQLTITNLEPNKNYYFEVMSHGKTYAFDAYYQFQTPKN